jgi:hypothetical protein
MAAARERRRRKRRSAEYQAPVTRRAAREQQAEQSRPARPAPRSRRDRRERPPSPWGSFPLVELVILIAVVLLVVGFLMGGTTRGDLMLVTGFALGMLAALELTLREHFAGYRSHTTLLSGFVTVVVLGVAFFMGWPQPVKLLAGVAAFALSFYLLREAFKRRSGGLGFR